MFINWYIQSLPILAGKLPFPKPSPSVTSRQVFIRYSRLRVIESLENQGNRNWLESEMVGKKWIEMVGTCGDTLNLKWCTICIYLQLIFRREIPAFPLSFFLTREYPTPVTSMTYFPGSHQNMSDQWAPWTGIRRNPTIFMGTLR